MAGSGDQVGGRVRPRIGKRRLCRGLTRGEGTRDIDGEVRNRWVGERGAAPSITLTPERHAGRGVRCSASDRSFEAPLNHLRSQGSQVAHGRNQGSEEASQGTSHRCSLPLASLHPPPLPPPSRPYTCTACGHVPPMAGDRQTKTHAWQRSQPRPQTPTLHNPQTTPQTSLYKRRFPSQDLPFTPSFVHPSGILS